MKKIYLDHSATTPIDKEVLKAMEPYFSNTFGNASSLHSFGQVGAKAVEDAREKIAKFLNCQSDEIIFTSGATEADNIAVSSVKSGDHIITTEIEHPAVLETCKALEKSGVEVSYVKPQSDGIVRVEDIKKEIHPVKSATKGRGAKQFDRVKDNTVLVSIMYVNNEIGTIQPIEEIGRVIKEENKKRENSIGTTSPGDPSSSQAPPQDKLKKILLHTDAVQAVNYCEIDVKKLGVDLMSISGHKIYGPKGIGVLYVKKPARNATHSVAGGGTKIKNIQHGGHHEQGIRPGTLNVPGIVGLGKAIELIAGRDNAEIKKLRDYCWQQIQDKISNARLDSTESKRVKLNGDLENRVPNNLNISFANVEGEALMLDLDLNGIAVSTGSACSSGSLEPSHVLMAIGLSHEDSHGSLRITLGKDNTKDEIDYFVKKLIASVEKFRKMAPEINS